MQDPGRAERGGGGGGRAGMTNVSGDTSDMNSGHAALPAGQRIKPVPRQKKKKGMSFIVFIPLSIKKQDNASPGGVKN